MLRRRTWKPEAHAVFMADPPEGWRIVVMLDIEPDLEPVEGSEEGGGKD